LGAVGGSIAVLAAAPIACGFGSAGIVASSSAAVFQAGVGNIAAGSAFAWFQSMGMTGALTTYATGGSILGTIGIGVAINDAQ
jgi:hypothetical protein